MVWQSFLRSRLPCAAVLTGASEVLCPPRETSTILIVDDDPSAIQVIAQALAGLGECCFATDAMQAMAMLDARDIDVVLLDALMPGLDGFEACSMILERHPALPILFVTAATDHDSEVRALQSGAVDFITKPINGYVVRLRVRTQLKLKMQADLLRRMAVTDPLTGVANRRALDQRMDREWAQAAQLRHPLSLLLIDIDFFKRYNDHYGHIAGDECLQRVACAIDAVAAQAGGLAARFGGEEFALLLPGIGALQAVDVGERIAAAIEALAISHAASVAASRLTVSIGVGSQSLVAGQIAQCGPVALFRWADQALYEAKVAGRNCVRASGGDSARDDWRLSV